MIKVESKDRILKQAREKQLVTNKGISIGYQLTFQQKLFRPKENSTIYLVMKGKKKTLQPRMFCFQVYHSKLKER